MIGGKKMLNNFSMNFFSLKGKVAFVTGGKQIYLLLLMIMIGKKQKNL